MRDAISRVRVAPVLALIPILCALLLPPAARAVTWLVRPDGTGDFPTIQQALNGAAAGDIIQLANGTFTGVENRDLDFKGKALTLCSQSGNAKLCVLDCQQLGRGFYFFRGEGPGSIVRNLSVVNGYNASAGGGARLTSSSPTFQNVIFGWCRAGWGGGVYT